MKKVYFLCTGNSCRSQMAEGFAKEYLPSDWEIRSAGVETHGLNPRGVAVMKEVGLDISQQTSDLIDPAYFATADLIVTLCGDAVDRCPMIPAGSTHLHWDLADPAKAQGSEEEIQAAFRNTRAEIATRMKALAETLRRGNG